MGRSTAASARAPRRPRALWLTVEWPPQYAPEFTDIEPVWRDLVAHHLPHQAFQDAEALDQAIHHPVQARNQRRRINPLGNRRIAVEESLGAARLPPQDARDGETTDVDMPAASAPRLRDLPDFWRLWGVGLIASLVRWLEMLAVSLFVYERTGSAFLVAMMGMLRILPMGLFGAFIGALAERVELQRALLVIVVASLLSSAVLGGLAALGALEVWHLAVASFLNGIAWGADNPVRRMMIGQVVGGAKMGRAMSADVGSANASRMLGPTLSGVIFAAVGVEGAFFASVLLYIPAVVAAATLSFRSGTGAAGGAGVGARIAEGFAVIRANPQLKGTLAVTVIFNIFGWPATSVVPVVAQAGLGLGAEATGVLSSMDGVGAFLGALVVGAVVRPAWHRHFYVGGVAAYCGMLVAFALAGGPVTAGAALLMVGLGQAGFSIMQATLIYSLSPPEMRGRVLGLLSMFIGLGPIGFLHVGLLADAVGASWACAITGAEGLLALALTRRLWRTI